METKLPDLKIVPGARLVLHEESDPARTRRISERLKQDKTLGNPPIVGRVKGASRLIILDGANRVSAFEYLKIESVMVQIVDYSDDSIRLTRWHHLLLDYDAQDLVRALE